MNIGVTGHQKRVGADWQWVRNWLNQSLPTYPALVGWSSLAAGADQLFAEVVLAVGGQLNAVIPLREYTRYFRKHAERDQYERLLLKCSKIIQLDNVDAQSAFFEAGKTIVKQSNLTIAIWDQMPSHGLGGTADVVKFAKAVGHKVIVLNPVTRREFFD